MGNLLKNFLKNLKEYLSYIMKVGFIDLFAQFFTLLIILLLACFLCVPLGLLQDVIVSALRLSGSSANALYNLIDLLFKIVSLVCVLVGFMYLFNKRYDDVQKMKDDLKKQEEKQEEKEKMLERAKEDEKLKETQENEDLPKVKEDN